MNVKYCSFIQVCQAENSKDWNQKTYKRHQLQQENQGFGQIMQQRNVIERL